MFGYQVSLCLEYILEQPNFEPYLKTQEFKIEEYEVTDAEVPGKPVLGLQIKENGQGQPIYRLYRDPELCPIGLVDDGSLLSPRAILIKIKWRDSYLDDGVAAAYIVSGQEHIEEAIDEEREDIEWKYILKKANNKYYLIHKIPDVAGNVGSCQKLEEVDKINCRNPVDDIERTKCRAYKCPPPRQFRPSSLIPW